MKDFVYFCIGLSYVRYVRLAEGLSSWYYPSNRPFRSCSYLFVLYSLSNVQVWYWRISTFP